MVNQKEMLELRKALSDLRHDPGVQIFLRYLQFRIDLAWDQALNTEDENTVLKLQREARVLNKVIESIANYKASV